MVTLIIIHIATKLGVLGTRFVRRGAKRSAFVAPLPAQWTSSNAGWTRRLVRRSSTRTQKRAHHPE